MAMTTEALRALLGIESADGIMVLATITTGTGSRLLDENSDPVLDENSAAVTSGAVTLYLARNHQDVTSRGITFIGYPFDLALATDGDVSPRMQLRIANVDRRITDALIALVKPPGFKIEVILISAPDTVLRTFDNFVLRNFSADAISVEADLAQERLSTEPWPRYRAIPSLTPLFFS